MEAAHVDPSQIINLFTLGQIMLVISLCLITGGRGYSANLLAGLCACIGTLLLPSLSQLAGLSLSIQAISLLLGLPALLLTGPLLWFFVLALTSSSPWRLKSDQGRHLILPGLGVIIALLTGLLPDELLLPLLQTGQVPANVYIEFLMISAFALILGWTIQSGYYLINIIKQLKAYRVLLRSHFANNDNRELYWLNALITIIVLSWAVAALSLLIDNLTQWQSIGNLGGAIIALIIVWMLALFGLRQSPGFEGRYLQQNLDELNDVQEETQQKTSEKYQRSALETQQAERIANKLETLMREQELYLDPDISLSKLAGALGTPSNYVSQTLNETMDSSFFDYINRWRIKAAEALLIENQQSVLDVAMAVGFNARSSFYNAFKQHTGLTPSEFRKQHNASK